jgi:hypothetical protein
MRMHRILIWIGGAIGISVGAAWAMMLNHAHPEYVLRSEMSVVYEQMKAMQEDIRDMRGDISDQFRLLLERLQRDADRR